MIHLEHPAVCYSPTRAPFHDGTSEEHAWVEAACPGCGQRSEHKALEAIASGARWYGALSVDAQRHIAEGFHFDFAMGNQNQQSSARMPNGRRAYFSLIHCTVCGSDSVIALDLYEQQPMRFTATLQGVAALRNSDPA